MSTTVKIDIAASDNGSFNNVNKEAQKVYNTVDKTQKLLNKPATQTAAYSKAKKETEGGAYAVGRGTIGTGAEGRDFAKQSQGLGGLVHVYATFAANIFAVSAAFTALSKAMDYEVMIKGAKLLEASTGSPLRNMAANMKDITEGALSMKESLGLTTLASSAGLSSKQIENLTKGAKGASIALGRDMSDSITRVIRGVTKLEPELLDELGVTVKATEAQRMYAKGLGVSVDSLSSYQKMAAYTEAVQKQLNDKFKDASELKDINPYTQLLGTAQDAATSLLNILNKGLTPAVKYLAENMELVIAGIVLIGKSLLTRALPEIGKMFTIDKAQVAKSKEYLDDLSASWENHVQDRIAAQAVVYNKELDLANKHLKDVETAQKESINRRVAISKTFIGSNPDVTGVKGIINRGTSSNVAAANLFLEEKRLSILANIEKQELRGTQNAQKISNNLKGQLVLTEELLGVTSKEVMLLEQKAHAQQRINTLKAAELVDYEQKGFVQAKADTAKAAYQHAQMQGRQNVQQAIYLEGAGSDLVKQVKVEELEKINKAQIEYAKTTRLGVAADAQAAAGHGIRAAALGGLNTALIATGGAFTKFSIMAASAMARLQAAMGIIGLLATAAFLLYEAFQWASKAMGLYSKAGEQVNKVGEESVAVHEAAYTSLAKYNKLNETNTRTLEQEVELQKIRANTLEASALQLEKEAEAIAQYAKEKQGYMDSDKLAESKLRVLQLIDDAIAKSSGAELKALKEQRAEVSNVGKSYEDYSVKVEETGKMLLKAADNSKSITSRLGDIKTGLDDFAAGMAAFNKKELISDSNLRKAYEGLDKVKKEFEELKKTGDIQAAYNKIIEMDMSAMKNIGGKDYSIDLEKLKIISKLKQELANQEATHQVIINGYKAAGLSLDVESVKMSTLRVSKAREELAVAQAKSDADITSMLDKAMAGIKAAGNANKGAQQRSDYLQSIISLHETEVSVIKQKIKQEEELNGYASESLIIESRKSQELAIQAKFNKEMEDALKKSKEGGNKATYENTKKNLILQRDLQLSTLSTEQKLDTIKQRAKKYEIEVTGPKLRQAELSSTMLENAKALETISEKEYINKKYLLDLNKEQLINAQKLRELEPGSEKYKQELAITELKQEQLRLDKETSLELSRRKSIISDLQLQSQLLSSQMTLVESTSSSYNDRLDILGKQKSLLYKQLKAETDILDIKIQAAEKDNDTEELTRLGYQRQIKLNQAAQAGLDIAKEELAVKLRTSKYSTEDLAEDFGNKLNEYSKTLKSGAETLNEAIVNGIDKGIDDLYEALKKGELTLKGIQEYVGNFIQDTIFEAAKADAKKWITDMLKGSFPGTKIKSTEQITQDHTTAMETHASALTGVAGITAQAAEGTNKAASIQVETANTLSGTFDQFGTGIKDWLSGNKSILNVFGTLITNLGSTLMSSLGLGGKGETGNFFSNLVGGFSSDKSAGSGILGTVEKGWQWVSSLFSASPAALGGVFSGSQGLSRYSNSVVSSPTLFAFAKGTGLMGEAGPEAIMPLKRAPDGSLGVRAAPTSNNETNNSKVTNLTINVSSQNGDPAEIKRSTAAAARAVLATLNGAKRYG